MKEIKFNFREVSVDGEPTETAECFTIKKFTNYDVNVMMYSAKHEAFNTRDDQTSKQARESMISGVLFWCPLSECSAAFTEDTK